MRNIMRAIARLLGIQTQPTDKPVQPTLTVGHVSQELIQQFGKVPSAQDTQPVQTESKAKRSAARPTTAEASPKPAPTTVKRKPTARGKQAQTPASKTRQHVKQAAKPKR
jgi:hypothetical protein